MGRYDVSMQERTYLGPHIKYGRLTLSRYQIKGYWNSVVAPAPPALFLDQPTPCVSSFLHKSGPYHSIETSQISYVTMFTWHSWMLCPLLGFCGQSQDKNITKELLTMNVVSVHPASVLSLHSLTYLTLVWWRKGYNEDARSPHLSLLFLLLGPHLFFSCRREISMWGLC